MADDELIRLIRQMMSPLAVEPTGERARLHRLPGIRAVILDVYGTLFLSACGDIGLTAKRDGGRALTEALQAEGLPVPPSAEGDLAESLRERVAAAQQAARDRGIAHPEIEIRDIWRQLTEAWGLDLTPAAVERMALRYECLVNPVWPMPGLVDLLRGLAAGDRLLGIVSNAQYYTPPLFEALAGDSLAGFGFRDDLCLWSYREGESKPSRRIFAVLCERLDRHGIAPHEAIYVGNDMRNDVDAAAGAGLRTALFAGDARSLRRRREDRLEHDPDLILTELAQLPGCLG